MSPINLMGIVIIFGLSHPSFAMDEHGMRVRYEQAKRVYQQGETDKFWREQFGSATKATLIPKEVQTYIARNFLLPISKEEKERKKIKCCLPLVIRGLTPAHIESVEKNLNDFHAQYVSAYKNKHQKEPDSLRPTIIAYADSSGEVHQVTEPQVINSKQFHEYLMNKLGPVSDREVIAFMDSPRVVIYSNGSTEWHLSLVDHNKIRAFSAEKKVLAERLYKESLDAGKNLKVQLGRQRIVDDRYDELFLAQSGPIRILDATVAANYSNLQTKQTKMLKLLYRSLSFAGNIFSAWFSYKLFFKNSFVRNKPYPWNKPLYGIIGTVGLSYVAAGLIQATKNLMGALINI